MFANMLVTVLIMLLKHYLCITYLLPNATGTHNSIKNIYTFMHLCKYAWVFTYVEKDNLVQITDD